MHVHKAVEPSKLNKVGKERLARFETNPEDFGLFYKYDGVYVQFQHTVAHGWQAFSRTGERIRSLPARVFHRLYEVGSTSTTYVGEIWMWGRSHSEINGLARKHSPQDDLVVVIHDSFFSIDLSLPASAPYRWRLGSANVLVNGVSFLKAYGTQRSNMGEAVAFAKTVQSHAVSAYDGLILRDMNAPFIPGNGAGGEIIKIKPRNSGDFLVVGTTEGKGNRACGIGALVLALGGGVTCEVGAGLTGEDVLRNPDYFIGKIVEVEYLSVTKDGKLREPSVKSIRWDKQVPDVLPGNIKGDD